MEEIKSIEIIGFMQCKKCVKELPEGLSPREYINIEIGVNLDNQMLLNCVRHEKYVGAFTLKDNLTMEVIDNGCDCCG